MVKSLETMKRIASIIGKDEDIAEYDEKIELRKRAIRAAYFNAFDGNFIMNVQGANAFAVDIGLGTKNTYKNLVNYYTKLGHYDTGIFATDILTRVLFENGNAALAARLLTQNGDQGFEHWRKNGATTFHEYWDSNRSRSHNHPMFGAPVAYLFEHLLGIGQRTGTAGFSDLVIEPKATALFGRMAGSIETVRGKIAVSYEHKDEKIHFSVTVPEKTTAIFRFGGKDIPLAAGENRLTF
jgi:alpha-L-rhamnosidase